MGKMRNPIRALALLVLSLSVPVEARAAEPREVRPHPCQVPGYDQDVLCATYPVWENRATRQGRKIGLNIVILPALGPDKQPDPVFELGGGPGQGIAESAGGLALSSLRQKRDYVLVDQRGTGLSNPLNCNLYGNPVDFRRAAGDLYRPEEIRKCRAKLKKAADLTRYTTAAFADDLNEVRQWLGYDMISLSGGSYGTRMAQVYLRRHPETVRSVLLLGVVPVDLFLPLRHAYAGQRALDLLLAECAAQPECHAAFPDVDADLRAIKERIDEGVIVAVTNTRTGERQEVRPVWGMVAEGIRFLLYGQGGGSLPLQVRKAVQGDLAPLVQMAIEQRLAIDEILAMGLFFSVTCAEDLPYITEQMIGENTPGTFLGDYRIRQQKAVCQLWPQGKVPADVHELVRSDVPVLLLSGERDPVTPPEMAEQAARFLTNSLHVAVPRGGHGGGGDCIENLIRDFIDRASVQGLDTSCVADINGPVTFMLP
jgi:pimeloyl-ACP methyl ester carboxylesterase